VPGLYAWLRRHPRLADGALALLLTALGTDIYKLDAQALLDIPLILGMVVPVVFRREYPVGAFTVVIIVGALQVLLGRPVSADLSVLIMLYTLAAHRPRRTSLLGLAICLVGAAAAVVRWHPADVGDGLYAIGVDAAVFGAPVLLAWLLGDSARWRRVYYQALEERARRLERERDAQAKVAAAAERARIARELHDVVAHNVSVMVVQADGAAYALDSSPQRAAEALAAISATGRRALAELRSLLGVLHNSAAPDILADPAPTRTPQPGIDELGELLEQARGAGLPVVFTVSGVPRPVPQGQALAVYRVVQESLTNIRKHAGPAVTAEVSMDYSDNGLMVRVTDDGAGDVAARSAAATGGAASASGGTAARLAGAGQGLMGMRERIELYGGTVRSGPRVGGGYEVVAKLPLALEAA
jgi:signal transduction histidine kinase